MNDSKDGLNRVSRRIRSIVIGVVSGTVVCLLLLLIMAAILSAQDIPQVAVGPMAVIAAAVGAFVGGFLSARIAGEKGLLFGALCGLLLYLLILLAGTMWFRDTQNSYLLLKLAILAACGAVGGVVGVNLRKR